MRWLVLIVVAAALAGCGAAPAATPAAAPVPTAVRIVTIEGSDGMGGTIDPVNVWDNYETRGVVVARLRSGDKVTLIERDGKGVRIETADGTRGWVTESFIREFQ